MSKGTELFEQTIKNYLDNYALTDEIFAMKYKDEKKNMKDCVQYILNEVQKLGVNGMADDEVFGLSKHYFDENEVDIGKEISARVLINKSVEFTDEDKAEIKKEARGILLQEAMKEMKAPKKKKTVEVVKEQQSLF